MRGKQGAIVLPKEYRHIPGFIADIFSKSVLWNDPGAILDMAAVLAIKANRSRGELSKSLKRSAAGRFVDAIDDAIDVWQDRYNEKINFHKRTYLYWSLYHDVSTQALALMERSLFEGLKEEVKQSKKIR